MGNVVSIIAPVAITEQQLIAAIQRINERTGNFFTVEADRFVNIFLTGHEQVGGLFEIKDHEEPEGGWQALEEAINNDEDEPPMIVVAEDVVVDIEFSRPSALGSWWKALFVDGLAIELGGKRMECENVWEPVPVPYTYLEWRSTQEEPYQKYDDNILHTYDAVIWQDHPVLGPFVKELTSIIPKPVYN